MPETEKSTSVASRGTRSRKPPSESSNARAAAESARGSCQSMCIARWSSALAASASVHGSRAASSARIAARRRIASRIWPSSARIACGSYTLGRRNAATVPSPSVAIKRAAAPPKNGCAPWRRVTSSKSAGGTEARLKRFSSMPQPSICTPSSAFTSGACGTSKISARAIPGSA